MTMRSKSPFVAQCGALSGLALLLSAMATADDALRRQVQRDFGHRSYMLVEDADGARLYLFTDRTGHSQQVLIEADDWNDAVARVLDGTRSDNPRQRVRALTQLAGIDSSEALDVALTLLSDPSAAVRDEAANLILDHPDGQAVASALGLLDDDSEE
ncbi:MAG: HEAT repeat domain-containing protein [Woeseiaceae bacterium]|nr:HEAT repeat domain-containing protein [Woeseiaceae bacterium]